MRALAWDAWATGAAWTSVVKVLDPAAFEVVFGVPDRSGPRPASWTETIRARFSALPDPPYNIGTSSTNNPTP